MTPPMPDSPAPKYVPGNDARVLRVLMREFGVSHKELNRDARLRAFGDSLDLLEVIYAIEREFEQGIPDDEIAKFVTVGDLLTYCGTFDA